MIVADLMTKSLVTVSPETSLASAARIMLERHLSGLLVLDGAGRLVGVITEGDLLRRAELGTADRHANWLDGIDRGGVDNGQEAHQTLAGG